MLKTIARSVLPLALALALALQPLAAEARERSSASLSLEQAAERVKAQSGGRILAARVVQHKERVYYEIQVLIKPGHVRVYRIDPDTGRNF